MGMELEKGNGTEIVAGLIMGRHPLPVAQYILDDVQDVTDFDGIEGQIRRWLAHAGITYHAEWWSPVIHACLIDDCSFWVSDQKLVVYVTGLTAATAALVKVCMDEGIRLTLMHYDRVSGNYFPQEIFDI